MDKGEQLAGLAQQSAVTVVYRYRPSGQRGQRAGVGTTLHERLSSAGANALGGRGGLGTSGVRALYSKSALIQVNCG